MNRIFSACLLGILILSSSNAFSHGGKQYQNGCHTNHSTGIQHCHDGSPPSFTHDEPRIRFSYYTASYLESGVQSIDVWAEHDLKLDYGKNAGLKFYLPKQHVSEYSGRVYNYEDLAFWADVRLRVDGDIWASVDGDAPRTNISGHGSVSYEGTLVGFLLDGTTTHGDAKLTVDLNTLTGSARFTDIKYFHDLFYDFTVNGNTFKSRNGELGGAFFGDRHQGAGGVIARPDLIAAFGAMRN